MNVEKAGINDIDALVKMRLDYLHEDNGSLTDCDIAIIRKDLPVYFRVHMDKDLFIYVIRERQEIVACAFLLSIARYRSKMRVRQDEAVSITVSATDRTKSDIRMRNR